MFENWIVKSLLYCQTFHLNLILISENLFASYQQYLRHCVSICVWKLDCEEPALLSNLPSESNSHLWISICKLSAVFETLFCSLLCINLLIWISPAFSFTMPTNCNWRPDILNGHLGYNFLTGKCLEIWIKLMNHLVLLTLYCFCYANHKSNMPVSENQLQ